jgi:hypothetical protein
MPWPNYIYNEKTKHLEMLDGTIFLDNNSEPAIFESVDQAYRYLKENNINGLVGRKLNMD